MTEAAAPLADALRTVASLAGWAAAALSAILSLPQLVRLLGASSPSGLPRLPWQGLLASNLAWLVYGLGSGQFVVVVPNAISAAFAVVAIVLLSGLGTVRRLTGTAAPVLFAAFAVVLAMPHPLVFAIVTIAPSVAGWGVQLARLIREGRPQTFSVPGVLLFVLCQACWLFYAISCGDRALGLSAAILTAVLGATALTALIVPPATAGSRA